MQVIVIISEEGDVEILRVDSSLNRGEAVSLSRQIVHDAA